jgi:hypothetical protein
MTWTEIPGFVTGTALVLLAVREISLFLKLAE